MMKGIRFLGACVFLCISVMLVFVMAACEPPPPGHEPHDESVTATVSASGGWPSSSTIKVTTTRAVKSDMVFAISFSYSGGGASTTSVVIAKGGTSGTSSVNGALLGIVKLRFDASQSNVYSFSQLCNGC